VWHIDVIIHKTTLCHKPENHNFSNNSFDNLKTTILILSPHLCMCHQLLPNLRADYILCGSRKRALSINDFFRLSKETIPDKEFQMGSSSLLNFLYIPLLVRVSKPNYYDGCLSQCTLSNGGSKIQWQALRPSIHMQ
jgi:hypothetical protein